MPHCLALCWFPHARLESAQGEAERVLMPITQQATSRPPLLVDSSSLGGQPLSWWTAPLLEDSPPRLGTRAGRCPTWSGTTWDTLRRVTSTEGQQDKHQALISATMGELRERL